MLQLPAIKGAAKKGIAFARPFFDLQFCILYFQFKKYSDPLVTSTGHLDAVERSDAAERPPSYCTSLCKIADFWGELQLFLQY
jgi:hypothetical protein